MLFDRELVRRLELELDARRLDPEFDVLRLVPDREFDVDRRARLPVPLLELRPRAGDFFDDEPELLERFAALRPFCVVRV